MSPPRCPRGLRGGKLSGERERERGLRVGNIIDLCIINLPSVESQQQDVMKRQQQLKD